MSQEGDEADLVTCEVTIDLDYDSDNEFPVEIESFEENDLDEIIVDPPINPRLLRVKLPTDARVRDLSHSVVSSLVQQLDIPSYVSVASWLDILAYFKTPSFDVQRIEKSGQPMEQFFIFLNNQPAQKLFDAFESLRRIDLLLIVKQLSQKTGILKLERDYQIPAPYSIPNPLHTVSLAKSTNAQNIILINHYEKTAKEKKIFKWFMKNLRENLTNFKINQLVPMDISEIENDDGGNIYDTINNIYLQAPHIIFCYNSSFLDALASSQPDAAFQWRKYVHTQANSEFVQNDMKNQRCRCVLMPGIASAEKTGWSTVTHQYSFPDGIEQLFKRLERTDLSNLNTI